MPIIIAQLLGGLVAAAGSLVGRVLISLGFGFATYSGYDLLINTIKNKILSLTGSFSSSALVEWAGFLQIDRHISLVLSAITAKVLLIGLTDGKKFLSRK